MLPLFDYEEFWSEVGPNYNGVQDHTTDYPSDQIHFRVSLICFKERYLEQETQTIFVIVIFWHPRL